MFIYIEGEEFYITLKKKVHGHDHTFITDGGFHVFNIENLVLTTSGTNLSFYFKDKNETHVYPNCKLNQRYNLTQNVLIKNIFGFHLYIFEDGNFEISPRNYEHHKLKIIALNNMAFYETDDMVISLSLENVCFYIKSRNKSYVFKNVEINRKYKIEEQANVSERHLTLRR